MGYIVTLKEYIKDGIISLKERWFLQMKVVSLTCPGCGANLSIEDGRKQCFCEYCGMKIMLDDESIISESRGENQSNINGDLGAYWSVNFYCRV